jgi:hypothetical protein
MDNLLDTETVDGYSEANSCVLGAHHYFKNYGSKSLQVEMNQ